MSENDKRWDGGVHRGAESASPYALSRGGPAFGLVDAAREIERADAMLGAVVGGRLEQIAEQIRALQDQARDVLERARRDADLHRAECRFVKKPGGVYHLYRRADGRAYFSMISPDEWGASPPDAFEGSWRVEVDLSFSPAASEPRDAVASARRLLATR